MRLTALLLLAVASAAACSGSGAASGPTPTPTAPSGTVVRIVPADNGGSVVARVGDLVQVSLGDGYTWVVDPPDGVVLVADDRRALLVRGTQAVFRAASTGRTSVAATGTAACPTGAACPMFAVLFRTTVVVGP